MGIVCKEQQHAGGVKSRIHDTCLVQNPVTIVIEGKVTELSLVDAKMLLIGLQTAVAHVELSEASLKGGGLLSNLAIIGKTGLGMSFPRSKLGDIGQQNYQEPI